MLTFNQRKISEVDSKGENKSNTSEHSLELLATPECKRTFSKCSCSSNKNS